VLAAIRGISEKSEPIGALIGGINTELEAGRASLEQSMAARERSVAGRGVAEGERVA
jgi:hypothetical protein